MIINRKEYVDRVISYFGKGLINIITGQRRVGKSTIMNLLISKFDSSIYIDMELFTNRNYKNQEYTYSYIKNEISQKNINIVCIDEVQNILGREEIFISLSKEFHKTEFVLTGSNSKLLSSDLSTKLRGRYNQTHIFPFSYNEFCEYYKIENNNESMIKYINTGSMPSIYQYESIDQKREQMTIIINTIFIKDIIERYNIRDAQLLTELFLFVIENTGSITNIQNIKNYLKNKNIYTNINTIQDYMGYLTDSFLIYPLYIYDTQGKSVFDRQKKYYPSDHIRRKVLLGDYDLGIGKQIETIVYFELLRNGRNVMAGRIKDKEIDFIATKGSQKIYIQATYLLSSEDVVNRELTSLKNIRDNYPKYIVSMDNILLGNMDGIKHLQLWNLDEILK